MFELDADKLRVIRGNKVVYNGQADLIFPKDADKGSTLLLVIQAHLKGILQNGDILLVQVKSEFTAPIMWLIRVNGESTDFVAFHTHNGTQWFQVDGLDSIKHSVETYAKIADDGIRSNMEEINELQL